MCKRLKTRFVHLEPAIKAVLIFVLFNLFSLLLPLVKTPLDIGGILGATSIFYSILLGFFIAAAMSNLSRLKTLVATETGALIAIYNIVKLALPDRVAETKSAIDTYLIKRFDYEIDNYTEPTTEEFFGIFNVLKGADTKSEGEGAALNYVAEALYYVAQSRREVTIVGAKIADRASWIILSILSFVIVASLFLMRDGSIQAALITSLLSSAAVMALFILDDLDGNRFGEEHFAIDTYQDVFTALGEDHYYPKHYLEGGRYKPKIKNYRTEKTIRNSRA